MYVHNPQTAGVANYNAAIHCRVYNLYCSVCKQVYIPLNYNFADCEIFIVADIQK